MGKQASKEMGKQASKAYRQAIHLNVAVYCSEPLRFILWRALGSNYHHNVLYKKETSLLLEDHLVYNFDNKKVTVRIRALDWGDRMDDAGDRIRIFVVFDQEEARRIIPEDGYRDYCIVAGQVDSSLKPFMKPTDKNKLMSNVDIWRDAVWKLALSQ